MGRAQIVEKTIKAMRESCGYELQSALKVIFAWRWRYEKDIFVFTGFYFAFFNDCSRTGSVGGFGNGVV